MPWHIARNAYGCKGYAVVKDGTSEVEGCHQTRASAEKQMSALYASESKKAKKMLSHYDMLSEAEKRYHDALVEIADEFGKFDESGEGIWAGYESAGENEDADIGVKCSNCSFFVEQGNCQIINALVEPDGKCRLAAIPGQLVKNSRSDFWKGQIGVYWK